MSLNSFIKNVPLSPAVTGTLLFLLTKAPEQLRAPALQRLSQYLSPRNIARAITTLKWLCTLGVARNLHIWLSTLAQNNFRLRSEAHRYNWPNEIAVVTGACSGFGALITKGLAANGINVMAVDVRPELPEDMKLNPRIQHYTCDITDRAAVMELAEKIRKQYGDPSILINNAGILYRHGILQASEKELDSIFDVNIISHYWTLQAFMPAMIANHKGHIVALASMASYLSSPGLIPYCNTKHAVLSLYEGLQQELRVVHEAPEIKVTSVHPTFADTPMAAPYRKEMLQIAQVIDPQTVADAIVNQVLSGRGGQLILGGDIAWMAGIKGWPHWLSQTVAHLADKKMRLAEELEAKRVKG